MMIVDNTKCTKCYECIKICPKQCIYPENGVLTRVHEVCANCEYCCDVCPNDAIKVNV